MIILSLLLILMLAGNMAIPHLINRNTSDFSEFIREMEAFDREMRRLDSISAEKRNRAYETSSLNPFPFDPNGLPAEKWHALGLKDWQIRIIKNYEAKGGRFRDPGDLQRIYGISDEEFNVLKPWIVISESPERNSHQPSFTFQPFEFDPNELPEEKWSQLGINGRLASRIMNYRTAGGYFREKADLMKIYGFPDSLYAKLDPYIKIKNEPDTSLYFSKEERSPSLMLDINTADSLDLQQLKGIGPSFAGRIIKYRQILGGYCSTGQLLEVYGMDSSRFDGIIDHIFVGGEPAGKININTAGIKEMIRHPYIEFYLAKSIIQHREKTGGYEDIKQILDARLIYPELYAKISPYLTIE